MHQTCAIQDGHMTLTVKTNMTGKKRSGGKTLENKIIPTESALNLT
jgi:hypothetical protein